MRNKYVAKDLDLINDCASFKHTELKPGLKLNKPKFIQGDLVEYRWSQDKATWKLAIVLDNIMHNVSGHCLYKILSTEFGYREVHESVIYSICLTD